MTTYAVHVSAEVIECYEVDAESPQAAAAMFEEGIPDVADLAHRDDPSFVEALSVWSEDHADQLGTLNVDRTWDWSL